MKKCLKVAFGITKPDNIIQEIQKNGSKLGVEGSVQFISTNQELKIIVCGLKEKVDQFVDLVHKDAVKAGIANINIEPFVKVKDYRGVFRIIE